MLNNGLLIGEILVAQSLYISLFEGSKRHQHLLFVYGSFGLIDGLAKFVIILTALKLLTELIVERLTSSNTDLLLFLLPILHQVLQLISRYLVVFHYQ